ncbi:AAEL003410-PA [Aedes aegypti]|uniref:AAEL003410-PA n=1 Tax=Aedes aegypti TaxID=7159 RepID=Q17FG1_AEDAE|nr:AAEL003410-PA [Aedes aegypti]
MVQIVPDDEPSPIWSVPFPAVTICGMEIEGEKSEPLKSFCEKACWGEQCACCKALFTKTRTELGSCYTFNNLAAKDLFNTKGMTKDAQLSNASISSENWDVQAGYKSFDSSSKYYPRRVMDLSHDYELMVRFRIVENSSVHSHGNQSSIKVDLHNPADYPFKTENAILAEPGQSFKIAVHPKVRTGRRYLKFSCPQSINCCYGDQCQLQFFRIYSQQNCELECRTKYMMETRNCVLSYMPRNAGVSLCNESTSISQDQLQKEITLAARINNIPPSKYFVKTCNCLPSCNEIRYKSVVTKSRSNGTNNSESRKSISNTTTDWCGKTGL